MGLSFEDYRAKSSESTQACLQVGEDAWGTPQMEREAVYKVPRAFLAHELAPRECGMWERCESAKHAAMRNLI